jgi:ubiquinone/menaquinone biosynthesis C-methylase UbiE
MAERAHPEDPGFKDKYFGLVKNKYKQNMIKRYNFCRQYITGKTVLDIPCGVGWGTSLLSGYANIVGIDISAEAVEYAQKKYQKQSCVFKTGEMQSIPLEDNAVDVILCLEGFEHVVKETGLKFLQESQRVLKPGGLLIMTCPVLNERGKSTANPYHLYEYPEEELVAQLNSNFRIISLERFKGPEGPEYRAVVENIKGKRYLE